MLGIRVLPAVLAALAIVGPAFGAEGPQLVAHRTATGLEVAGPQGVLTIEPRSDTILHIRFAAQPGWAGAYNAWTIGHPAPAVWNVQETPEAVSLTTAKLVVRVAKSDGALSILAAGAPLLEEGWNGRVVPRSGLGPVVQPFATGGPAYGLGQHQNGMFDYSGSTVRLQQANRDVAVPLLISPKGFGILWNNASVTEVDVGQPVGAPLTFRSEAGRGIDYDVIYGPEIDQVIAGYRQLTGDAPLMPRWSWGLWQSKEHYATQAELLGVVDSYRSRGAPFDVVVQDWQYWPAGQWGSHAFDAARYPDPKAMMAQVHAAHAHAALSVWARFDLGTANLAELDAAGAVFPRVYPNVYPKGEGRWYDAWSPRGREIYWRQIRRGPGALGFDAWWLDASEAELGGAWGEMRNVQTAAGPGAEVYNSYPLLHTSAVYDGARRDFPGKRPVILTRSAFAGQQRNGAITWSGDTNGDWETFRRQIPAALNFSLSGIPYWSADIGGFFGGDPQDPAYAELFTRWYEFGVFNPMFRVHGTGKAKELWAFAPEVQKTLLDYDRLRYRLLPYIYATSWSVTHRQGTMMRPLVMDFRADQQTWRIADEYLFGPSLLVSPVVQAGARARTVYLPAGVDWFDFWTGERHRGGQTVAASAELGVIPLYAPAGAILPLGPVKAYADAPSDEPLEIRVYPGRDGAFELYDDEGDGFGYEQGRYATVRLAWDDAARVLRIGARQGAYPGMAKVQRLRIVCAAGGKGAESATYAGAATTVPLPACGS